MSSSSFFRSAFACLSAAFAFTLVAPANASSTGERAACVAAAAERYAVPSPLLLAVMRTEGGTTGRTSRPNGNGSLDQGLMQINEIHLPELARYGISREMVIHNECVNIFIGAFILSRELAKPGADYWTNVGAYNSRTPCERFYSKGKKCPNIEYQRKVAQHLANIL
ncbi:lytic transglycosylase domain-containing protein, partial [Stenotrophomonas sp. CASM106]|uniref:lytic transglycosylase domain-containing protein n=1 Tax=Stenotrophomonas sp. CASM106 TaxID=3111508 RepID=UPI003BF89FCD